jgi:hypothetical protein
MVRRSATLGIVHHDEKVTLTGSEHRRRAKGDNGAN